jgi:hypothetical protein
MREMRLRHSGATKRSGRTEPGFWMSPSQGDIMSAIPFVISADHFTNHPDSIAERLKEQELERSSNNLRRLRGIEKTHILRRQDDGPRKLTLRSPEIIRACPLPAQWIKWDMLSRDEKNYRFVSEEQHARCEQARRTRPLRRLGRVPLKWESADGKARPAVMTRLREGHIHAETTIATRLVHIDLVEITRGGPGRSITEVRIFVDGQLAGRGGSCGCSLGGGGNDLPAVAVISGSTVLSVALIYGRGSPLAELWKVKNSPISIERAKL